MKVIVSGAAGFIGRAMTSYLLDRVGAEVLGLVRDPEAPLGKGMRAITALEPADCVIHLAGRGGIPESLANPQEAFKSTCMLTTDLIDKAVELRIERFVMASTCAVYPLGPAPSSERGPFDLNSPYAESKFVAEQYVIAARMTGMKTNVARLANVYGPDQGRLLIHDIASRAQSAETTVSLRSSGAEKRDFIHVDDCAAGLWTIATVGATGEVYNLGSGKPQRVFDVAHAICSYFGKQLDTPPPHMDYDGQQDAFPDTAKLQDLGFDPRVRFDDGLQETLKKMVQIK